jgi:hypothetical protein
MKNIFFALFIFVCLKASAVDIHINSYPYTPTVYDTIPIIHGDNFYKVSIWDLLMEQPWTRQTFGKVKWTSIVQGVGIDVYDVNNDGILHELIDAVAYASSFPNSYINIASGAYNIDGTISLNETHSFLEINGNNTFLREASGFSGAAITITSTGDFTRLKIRDLTFTENNTRYQNWDGIKITVGGTSPGYDFEYATFTDLNFRYCSNAIHTILTQHGWINAMILNNVTAQAPRRFWKPTRTGDAGPLCDGNILINCGMQSGSLTVVGIDTLWGDYNLITNYYQWDSEQGGPYNRGIILGANSIMNFCSGDWDLYGTLDLGSRNHVEGIFVTSAFDNFRMTQLGVLGLHVYSGNSAAVSANEKPGEFYRTSTGQVMVVY